MQKFDAVVCNDRIDLEGDIISRSEMSEMSKSNPVSVYIAVNDQVPVGFAHEFSVNEQEEMCCRILVRNDIVVDGLFPVIGYMYTPGKNGERVGIKLMNILLTSQPTTVGTWMERMTNVEV